MSRSSRRLEAENLNVLVLSLSGAWKLEILLLLLDEPGLAGREIASRLLADNRHSMEVQLTRMRQQGLLDFVTDPPTGLAGRRPRRYRVAGPVARRLAWLRRELADSPRGG